eukprot:2381062-Lingulodinium_polyedra.AAC.1
MPINATRSQSIYIHMFGPTALASPSYYTRENRTNPVPSLERAALGLRGWGWSNPTRTTAQ